MKTAGLAYHRNSCSKMIETFKQISNKKECTQLESEMQNLGKNSAD